MLFFDVDLFYPCFDLESPPDHIVPFGMFHRMGGAPPKTFPNVKYDALQA